MRCSVVVPLYNKAKTLKRTLASIRQQTLSDWEALIVDDGSTDSSAAGVQSFIDETGDKRFRYIHQNNKGPGAARNLGIAQASAPVVAFLDADDEWLPHFLERSVNALEASGPATASLTMGWFEEPGHRSAIPRLQAQGLQSGIFPIDPDTPPSLLVSLSTTLSPCTTVSRREILLRYGGFREQRCLFGEDTYLYLQVLLNHPVALLLEEGALFHREDSDLSGNYSGMRPIEPFLESPQQIEARCPAPLLPLLQAFLAIRAMKTACVLAYWGQWRQAAALRGRFLTPAAWRLPWYFPSLLASTPAGPLAGKLARAAKGLR